MRRAGATAMEPSTLRTVPCPVCGGENVDMVLSADELALADRRLVPWRIVRCLVCAVVFVRQREAERSVRESYEGDGYGFVRSKLADTFVNGRPYAERIMGELQGLLNPGRLLDIGCAEGDLLTTAQALGWDALGVEVSPHATEVASRKGLDVFAGTVREAELPSDSFDAVTLLDVIEHLEDPLQELAEIHRILRPDGILVVETPNWNSIYRRILRRSWAALQPRLHIIYFEQTTLSALLSRAGFTVVRSSTEIGALLSAEGRARGLSPNIVRNRVRERVVRWRLGRREGVIDRVLLRVGPARRVAPETSSFKRRAEGIRSGEPRRRDCRPSSRITLRLNRGLDDFICNHGMGEQLRIHARKVAAR